jgi:hypothetical protein
MSIFSVLALSCMMRDLDLQLCSPARRPFAQHYKLRSADVSSEADSGHSVQTQYNLVDFEKRNVSFVFRQGSIGRETGKATAS